MYEGKRYINCTECFYCGVRRLSGPPQKKIDADVKKFYETLGIPSTPLPPPVEFKLYDHVECSAGVSAGV